MTLRATIVFGANHTFYYNKSRFGYFLFLFAAEICTKEEKKMKNILVIGASGFVGKHLTQKLLTEGYKVRCLVRNPDKVQDLATVGCEIIKGDITDLASVQKAVQSMDAVYIAIHTLSTQQADTKSDGFMDIELLGLQNIVESCKTHHVKRIIYVTFLGVDKDAASEWSRGRWKTEQFLLKSGLDATIIRPGMIVGVGGQGFNMMVGNAKKRFAIMIGAGNQKFRCIAIDDLIYYLVGVLNDTSAYGKGFDVGSDDILTSNQMLDAVAEVMGRNHPKKIHIPIGLLSAMAPIIERIAKMPKGAMKGMVEGIQSDMIGNPAPIRTILTKTPLTNREAVAKALEV